MKKRILSVLLALTMLLGLLPTAQAYALLTITQQPLSDNDYTVTATSDFEISYQWHRRSGTKVYTLTENTDGDNEISANDDSEGNYSETGWASVDYNYLLICYIALPGDAVTMKLSDGFDGTVKLFDEEVSGTDGVYTASCDEDDLGKVYIEVSSETASFSATITVTRSWEKLSGETDPALQTRDPGTYVCQVSDDYFVLLSDQVTLSGPVTAHSHPVCGAVCSGHTESHGDVTWTEFPTGTTALTAGSYYLTEDITTSGAFSISGEVNLCLNGHKIESTANLRTILIPVNATLNLCDCIGTGTISDNNNTCIQVNNTGKVNMYGGTISGNTYGINNQGNANIYGGSVSGTSANSSGVINGTATSTLNVYGGFVAGKFRGIYGTGGTVNVYDGAITGIDTGSGIVIATSGSVNVSGGTISGGTYGISHSGSGAFTLGGNPSIHGGTTDTDADLYFGNGNTVTVDSTLTSSATYSVKTKTAPTEAAPVAITAAASADYSDRFTSINASYAIRNTGTGSEQVVQLYKPHSHSWASDWTSDATGHWHDCTAANCTVTENSEKNGYAAHTSVAIGTAAAATCAAPGTTAGSKCSVCGYVIEAQTTIPATGHTWGSWTITADPTTEATGTAERVCTKDSSHKNTFTLPALNDTGVWTAGAKTEPTETTDGSQVYTSTYGTVTVTIPATGSAHTHAWATAWEKNDTHHWHNCTATGCTVTENSEKNGYAAHTKTWDKDTEQHWEKCSICDWASAKTAHIWNDGVVTKQPTATAEGVKTYTCTTCQATKTEAVPKLEPTTFAISGTVIDNKNDKVSGAVVKLMQGNTQIGETVTTGADGIFSFPGVKPGVYNIVATKGDVTMTKLVTVTNANLTNQELQMPDGNVNSKLEVKSGAPDVVVGGLDAEAENNKDANKTVTVTMTVEKKTESAAANAASIKQQATGKTLEFLDIKVEKKVGDETTPINEAKTIFEIVVPYNFTNKTNVTVYRHHDNNAAALTEADSKAEGTFRLDTANGLIYIYAQKFSTYAIGYKESDSTNPGSSGGGYITYPVNVPDSTPNGTVSVSPANAGPGTTVTLTLTPDEGYASGRVSVTDSEGKDIPITDKGDGKYTFTMPAGNVTVSVSFIKTNSSYAYCPKDATCPISKFTDASVTAWYHDGVHFCVEQGLMVGTSATTFAPGMDTSRAMIATILWRLEGSPEPKKTVTFPDCVADSWYAKAVAWASEVGVVKGYDTGDFGPDDPITREQLAAMLYRYTGSPETGGTLSGFTDSGRASGYALPALRWAVDKGIITGKGGGVLDPAGLATRAEAAAMLQRFLKGAGA